MMTPTEQYKYDSKFRQIVDILRDELRRSVKFGLLLSMQVKERRIGVANRLVSVKLGRNKSTGDRRKHIHDFKYTGRGYDVCDCGISSVYYSATKPKTATGSNL